MIDIKKIINEEIESLFLNEGMSMDDWYDYLREFTDEVFHQINDKENVRLNVIPKNQYHNALREFVRYGQFMRFPTNKIHQWKKLILINIAKLHVLTDILGHSSNFPFEEFYDMFDRSEPTQSKQYDLFTGKLGIENEDGEFTYWKKKRYAETGDDDYLEDYDFTSAYEFLDDVKNMDDYLPLFSNGQWMLSDYGLQPLEKLGEKLIGTDDPNEIIVLINKVLDVTHQRSDLAELFIEGGSTSLDYISNNE